MNFSSSSVCNLCGRSDQLYRCVRCRIAVYCSKEHQKQHWKFHKVVCCTSSNQQIESKQKSQAEPSDQVCSLLPNVAELNLNSVEQPLEALSCGEALNSISSTCDASCNSIEVIEHENHHCDTLDSSLTYPSVQYSNYEEELLENVLLNKSTPLQPTSLQSPARQLMEMGSVQLTAECSLRAETRWQSSLENNSAKQPINPPFLHKSFNRDLSCKQQLQRSSLEWMTQICQYVACDLEKYGICVVDNFVGKERAESIHRSVVSMYHSGVFVEGETVSPSHESTKNVRSDKIAWVDGSEKHCSDIAYLISTIDTIIMNLVRMKGNGQLGQRTIGGRTKAMIACYPGSGSHYVKHVDNPNRDGRCITSTYYVNKDWDAKTVGGILRIFPQGWANQVVDIEPILDRMVFFWSDRRNPHEVQPAYRTRYAITVWYFDAKEREEARQRYNRENSNH